MAGFEKIEGLQTSKFRIPNSCEEIDGSLDFFERFQDRWVLTVGVMHPDLVTQPGCIGGTPFDVFFNH